MSSSVGSLFGEGSGKCEDSDLGEPLGVAFVIEVGFTLACQVNVWREFRVVFQRNLTGGLQGCLRSNRMQWQWQQW